MDNAYDKEVNAALTANLRHKSVVLTVLFAVILVLQVIALAFFYFKSTLFDHFENPGIVILGPLFLALALASEWYSVRYIDRLSGSGQSISMRYAYLVTFVEMSFPSFVLCFAGTIVLGRGMASVGDLLSSPPMIIYFIMIILSSLMLDVKLCIFAGGIAALEYALISVYFIQRNGSMEGIVLPNQLIKAVLILFCGVVAGFISRKIREAIVNSLVAKNDLIHNLDKKVNEKTAEIRKQKEEIEEKNKDITDSIHYARRIQQSLMPTEKYIHRHLHRLTKK
jgi:adenylate cyclase